MKYTDLSVEDMESIDIALCPYARAVSARYWYPDDPTLSSSQGVQASIMGQLQPILDRVRAGGAAMTVAEATSLIQSSGSNATYGADLKAQRILDLEVKTFSTTWTGNENGNSKISELVLEAKAWAGAPCVSEEP